MKKGDYVDVYEDVMSEEEPEGKARLVEKIKSASPVTGCQTWKVKFVRDSKGNKCPNDEPIVTRQVHERNLTI